MSARLLRSLAAIGSKPQVIGQNAPLAYGLSLMAYGPSRPEGLL
jgi:hypothetical protein